MPQQQPIVTPGDPTFDVEASPRVQVAHPSSTIPPRGPLPEWRSSSTNAGLPPHLYRSASIVVTAVILSRSAEIRRRHPPAAKGQIARFQSPPGGRSACSGLFATPLVQPPGRAWRQRLPACYDARTLPRRTPANAHPITARQAPLAAAKVRPFRRSTMILGFRSPGRRTASCAGPLCTP